MEIHVYRGEALQELPGILTIPFIGPSNIAHICLESARQGQFLLT